MAASSDQWGGQVSPGRACVGMLPLSPLSRGSTQPASCHGHARPGSETPAGPHRLLQAAQSLRAKPLHHHEHHEHGHFISSHAISRRPRRRLLLRSILLLPCRLAAPIKIHLIAVSSRKGTPPPPPCFPDPREAAPGFNY